MKYRIVRKHSEDSDAHITGYAPAKRAAQRFIREVVAAENALISTPHVVQQLDAVTNTKFTMGNGQTWSVGYWYELNEVA